MTWKPKVSYSSPFKGRCPQCGTEVPKIKYHVCENCDAKLEIKEETQVIVHVTIRGNPGW